ncbi:MAG TPA: hypothetical protein VGF45_07470 [Polyangia bacterium]
MARASNHLIGILLGVSAVVAGSASLVGFQSVAKAQGDEPGDRDFVLTPHGRYHKTCVTRIPNGGELNAKRQVVLDGKVVLPAKGPCAFPVKDRPRPGRGNSAPTQPSPISPSGGPLPAINGWVEWKRAAAIPSTGAVSWFNGLSASWVVPPAPTTVSDQTIFLFPALQDPTFEAIMQPVLQWGPSAVGGGQHWSIATWYIDILNNVYVSTLQTVNAGDSLFGAMSLVQGTCTQSAGSCLWGLSIQDTTTSVSSMMFVYTLENFTHAWAGALEVIAVDTCGELPNATSTTFSNVRAYEPSNNPNAWYQDVTAALTWSTGVESGLNPGNCGYGVGGSGSTAILSY